MTPRSKVIITKKSGQQEAFDDSKVYRSLLSSGATAATADEIIHLIKPEIKPGMSTRKIYRIAKRHLRRMDMATGIRFGLKEAIYALGPTGYPFERYIARLFEAQGYRTRVGQIVRGKCVSHEVDVIATRDNEKLMMECKFHHNGKQASDVKTALYVESRMRDIAGASRQSNPSIKVRGVLVTNTRLTSEAVKYAGCSGLRAIAWRHPGGESLEALINKTRAYPVTMLPASRRGIVETLINRGLVLVTDIQSRSAEALSRQTGLPLDVATRLRKQSLEVCR